MRDPKTNTLLFGLLSQPVLRRSDLVFIQGETFLSQPLMFLTTAKSNLVWFCKGGTLNLCPKFNRAENASKTFTPAFLFPALS